MRSFILLLAVVASLPAAGILIRPDRDDAEYVELANKYAPSVLLNAPDGEGVLIADRWILTAAHMARALQDLKPVPRIPIGGRDYEIQSFHLHPDWKKGNPGSDFALIHLKRAVNKAIEPARLYRGSDEGGSEYEC